MVRKLQLGMKKRMHIVDAAEKNYRNLNEIHPGLCEKINPGTPLVHIIIMTSMQYSNLPRYTKSHKPCSNTRVINLLHHTEKDIKESLSKTV